MSGDNPEREPMVARCGHLGQPMLFNGKWIPSLYCEACALKKAANAMPLDEALDRFAEMVSSETMDKVLEDIDKQRRRRPFKAPPSVN